jgi:hypothetical protein
MTPSLSNVAVVLLCCAFALFPQPTEARSNASAYVMIAKPIASVLGTQTLCDKLAVDVLTAIGVATQTNRSALGSLTVSQRTATFLNRTHSLAELVFGRGETRDALMALARFRAYNAVHQLGIVGATLDLNLVDKTKDEGVESYVLALVVCLAMAFATGISACCFRRAADRKSRSVKFKDLVQFEIEMASQYEHDDGGVPLPYAR